MVGRPNAVQSKFVRPKGANKFVMKPAFSKREASAEEKKIEVESNARPVIGQITGKGGKINDII